MARGKNVIGKKEPTRSVKVHIMEKEGSKHVRSKAFTIHGQDYSTVALHIEIFLRDLYGGKEDDN